MPPDENQNMPHLRCQVKIPSTLKGVPRGVAGLAAVVLFQACAHYQNVEIASEPPGAQVFLDGEQVGRTPLRVPIDRDRPHIVYLKLDGHIPRQTVLAHNPMPDGIDFLTPADVELRLNLRPRLPGQPTAEGAPAENDRDVDVTIEDPKKP